MTRAAVMRRLTVMQHGLSWSEAGRLTLHDYDTIVSVMEEVRQSQQQERPAARRSGGVTRTPIT